VPPVSGSRNLPDTSGKTDLKNEAIAEETNKTKEVAESENPNVTDKALN
jgi:hypothetical protein